MGSARNAAEQLRASGNKFRGFFEAIEYLEGLADLEQAEAQMKTNARIAEDKKIAAENALKAAEENLQIAEGKVKAVQLQAEEGEKAAKIKAEAIIANAKEDAALIIEDANQKAGGIEESVTQRQNYKASLDQAIATKEEELKNLEETIRQTKARISAL